MHEKINQEVSVIMYYSAQKRVAMPHYIKWNNKEYEVGTLGFYHNYLRGLDKQHIYELVDKDNSLWFRLRLDTSNLHWTLEAVHDGLAN